MKTTGRTYLGQTHECAECHDHKYDPVSQKEYYQLFAIFNNIPHLGKGYNTHGPRMAFGPEKIDIPVMRELATPRETRILIRGNFKTPGPTVEPALPGFLPGAEAGESRLDRLDFAQWLVREDHPLTARVAVNYLWQHFFGQGLVPTSADFGIQGEKPSHPALLDWLARELIESGWDRKHLIRLITSSRTYQRSGQRGTEAEADPQNRFLARMPRDRFSAEEIRDHSLAMAGQLVAHIGGPSVFPTQPAGYYEELGQNTAGNSNFTWADSTGPGLFRKSIYTYWKRMALHPSLAAFDAPTRQFCVNRRNITNTPQQALTLLNDPLFHTLAEALGLRLQREPAL
ncbi:MAG: DUF1553 domain-containing protein, partial [Verrucomicrobiota bacterium]